MLLVNKNGIVTQVWLGKLAGDKQEEALKTILGARSIKSATAAAALHRDS